jgi:hypothetical protein
LIASFGTAQILKDLGGRLQPPASIFHLRSAPPWQAEFLSRPKSALLVVRTIACLHKQNAHPFSTIFTPFALPPSVPFHFSGQARKEKQIKSSLSSLHL